MNKSKYNSIVFDLLTGLIDSWSLWNEIAGSELKGRDWRARYLQITYNTFEYKKYEDLVLLSAQQVGLNNTNAFKLIEEWERLKPWPEVNMVLNKLKDKFALGVATNCSIKKGNEAIELIDVKFDSTITAEEVGFYKPHPEMYNCILKKMNTSPSRTLFVAGSPFDVEGAKSMDMDVYWHNRVGLSHANEKKADYVEKSLNKLIEILT
ncbi:HAD-IA family hydrolase [Alphaproteobacteria bacterium]|nr:HAD-IA family hydrolase [Alphaproteobacteria bacterium]